MNPPLKEIFEQFETGAAFSEGYAFGSGHLHDTFRIKTGPGDRYDYILQRLNTNVFRDVAALQENLERVTGHLRKKISAIEGSDVSRECLTVILSKRKTSWVTDSEGSCWRMFIFITNHRSYDIVDSPEKAYQGGKAIGRFQAMLADLGGPPLKETIPDFHNIEKRLETFNKVLLADRVGRVTVCKADIGDVLSRAEKMKIILRLGREGKIPLRITHNDTKFNNILLDENDRALCIIDLDTVMPGYVHYDFGDAIRTGANSAAEDEKNLSLIKMNLGHFEAYTKGYLEEVGATLVPEEKEWLAFSPQLITYTMAVRFLTDYLDGDNYYKIHHEHHNLQRARAQLQLVKSMEQQYEKMREIVARMG
jgi:hypothetical protein